MTWGALCENLVLSPTSYCSGSSSFRFCVSTLPFVREVPTRLDKGLMLALDYELGALGVLLRVQRSALRQALNSFSTSALAITPLDGF